MVSVHTVRPVQNRNKIKRKSKSEKFIGPKIEREIYVKLDLPKGNHFSRKLKEKNENVIEIVWVYTVLCLHILVLYWACIPVTNSKEASLAVDKIYAAEYFTGLLKERDLEI
jgi:hypothetical protein